MGYSVPEHFAALDRLGPTIHHRRSFAPVAALYGEAVVDGRGGIAVLPLGTSAVLLIRASILRAPFLRRGSDALRFPFRRIAADAAALLFWTVALPQAALWTLCRRCSIAAPPGDLPIVLAIGHEFQLGTDFGPPLAFWLAEIAYRLGGHVRRLSALAGLRRRHLLGGVRARPFHRRRAARGAGGAADGRHRRVHGADAGIRAGHSRHAALGADAAALLACGRRAATRIYWVAIGVGGGLAAAHHLCRADL